VLAGNADNNPETRLSNNEKSIVSLQVSLLVKHNAVNFVMGKQVRKVGLGQQAENSKLKSWGLPTTTGPPDRPNIECDSPWDTC